MTKDENYQLVVVGGVMMEPPLTILLDPFGLSPPPHKQSLIPYLV